MNMLYIVIVLASESDINASIAEDLSVEVLLIIIIVFMYPSSVLYLHSHTESIVIKTV